MKPKPKILFLVPYPLRHAPSQRYRVELYQRYLDERGIEYSIRPFMDAATWRVLYKEGSGFQKVLGVFKGFYHRKKTIFFTGHKYDYVFIHREAAPLGPPIFEWMIAKLLRKKIIYDFDDAIWIPNTSEENKAFASLKAFWKVKSICHWAYKVAAGNNYLAGYAGQFNSNVVTLPTCVDVVHSHYKVKQHGEHELFVGWTGSHSTLFYLDQLLPVIRRLQERTAFTFVVIADKDPGLQLSRYLFIRWNEASEVDDLLRLDIGVMPLMADAWSEGKCGFKLIQYLALGIPAVASPVGVNKDIIEDGVNGFIANNEVEWEAKLEILLNDASLRSQMGKQGRQKIVEHYSVQSQLEKFLGLFS